MAKIFIDGASGTTALQIKTLLKPWQDAGKISLIGVDDTRSISQRKSAFQQADISILCLPDAVAKETVEMLVPNDSRIIDASSAHRVDSNWIYGFPELNEGQPNRIRESRRITNPGCYATGAISILAPLVLANVINPETSHTIFGVSGYTGGGKSLVELHDKADDSFKAANVFGSYSINTKHKHVAEIKKYAGLSVTPIFMPNVVNQPRGMIVSIPFNQTSLNGNIVDVQKIFENAYQHEGSAVKIMPLDENQKRLNFSVFTQLNMGTDNPIPHVAIQVTGWEQGNDNQITVHALLDNLGKGAGAQAVQNMKLMLG
jgi:N-acetyl-gamma-glutamyl-phosphate reductase